MADRDKTKDQLIAELELLRAEVAALKQMGPTHFAPTTPPVENWPIAPFVRGADDIEVTGKYTILLIDDSEVERAIYRRFLMQDRDRTYQIVEFDNGEEALEWCQQNLPDIFLIDYLLPDMDGLELLQQLQQQTGRNTLPVIMFTGQGNLQIAVDLLKSGAQDYLEKSQITPQSLHRAISYILRHNQLIREREWQQQQQQILAKTALSIRESLKLDDILNSTVREVRNILQCDRVIIFKFLPDWSGIVLVESVVDESKAILPSHIYDPCIGKDYVEPFKKGLITAKSDIYNSDISPCHIEFLESLQVRANLVVPITKGDELWGLLVAHHCTAPRQWQSSEIELLRQLSAQVSIAIQQADLFEQIQTESLRIQTLFNTSFDGIVILDEQGKVLDANPRFSLMLGYTPEETASLNVFDWDAHYTSEELQELLRDYITLESGVLETRHRRKDGSIYDVDISISVVEWQGEILRFCVCRDITDRKQAQMALQENEQKLQLFIKYAPASIVMFDREMRYIAASQRWVDEFRINSVESIIGRSHYEIFPNIPEQWKHFYQRGLAGFIEKCDEDFLVDSDGSERWFCWEIHPWYRANGDVGGIILFTEDITDRKQAQIALQQLNIELEQRVIERTAELTEVNDRLLLALLEKERAYQLVKEQAQLLDLAHDSIITWDLNSVITFWNQGAEFMYGWTKAEAFGQEAHTFLKTQFPQPLAEIKAQLLEKCYWEGELIHFTKYDRAITVSSRWVVQKDDAGIPIKILEIDNDITDRKQAEAALLQKSRQEKLLWSITQAIRQSLDLNAILNNAVTEVRQTLQIDRAAVYRFNPNWSGDFVVESVGEDWVKLVESGVGKVWEDTYLQETQGGRFLNKESFVINDIYRAGLQTCHLELLEQFQAKSYAVFPIFSGENLWGLLAIYQNATPRNWESWEIELLEQIASQLAIAIQQSELYEKLQIELQERQQAAAVLREAERRWRSLLDNVQLVVVGFDKTAAVNYVNPCFLKLTGYTESEALGKNLFETFIPPSDRQQLQTIFSAILTANAHPYYQNWIVTKSGEKRFISWNNTLLQDSVGNIIGTISIGEDITERQKIEKIKDEFIGIVSHELRTPLTAIQMSLGLLKTGIYDKKPEKSRRMIEIALFDTNRLVHLVNDILDLERIDSGRAVLEKTVCKAADLMQQAIDGIQAIATQQQISLTFTPTDAEVWAAQDNIIQTLTNLLGNALKFSPAHSTIHVSAEIQTDFVLFQVRDRGRGIPANKLELIFGRFQQVDASDSREKGGTGLGLAICQSIIERHGGKIWAESILGEGSTFFFTLPLPSID